MGGGRVKRRDLLRALRSLGARPVPGGKDSHERWERLEDGLAFRTTIPQREEFSLFFVATLARQLGLEPARLKAALRS
ncbi:MAG: hypothetical protein O3A20_04655 [Planctomycetota bacterium]|nr:hypothetical protein [Planctomycetota bacterium]